MPDTAPGLFIQFVDNLLRVANEGDRRIATQMLDLLVGTSFKINILEQYIKGVADCEHVTTRNLRKFLKANGLQIVLVREGMR